ncbi:MAG: hypothetical protein LBT87_09235 [Treponema sp.]|jgi:hypothetical protein|nr:hypothetical protein [Treponema sp.]
MEASFPARDSASPSKAFCAVEDWKSALMTLRDGDFFDLLRSVFGNIKTPFNKQRLLGELSAFLSRDEIRGNISRYIDERDAKLIAAVAVLGQPGPAELGDFFDGEINREDLRDLLLNLEERFILFRRMGQEGGREDPVNRLALNPVLEPVLAPFAANRALVFPSVPVTGLPGATGAALGAGPLPDDRLLAALISFAREEGNLFKAPGHSQAEGRGQTAQAAGGFLRKKVRETGGRIFPGLDLEALMGGLYCLGLLNAEGKRNAVNEEKLAAFRDLSPRDRLVYCAAGICCRLEGPGLDALSPHLSRGRVRFLASLIHRFLAALNPSRAYPRITLGRYAATLPRNEDPVPGQESFPVFDHLLAGMESAGLLRRVSDYWLSGPGLPPPSEADPSSSASSGTGPSSAVPALAMDAPFSFVIYPGVSFADVLDLASFTLVREAGTVVRFEMNRDSVVRGFDRGIGAGEMEKLLTRLSGNRLGDSLLWTLKDWEKRYGEVSLCEGIVLSLSPERCYLAEAEPVASLVRRVLAPGVFLLSAQEYSGQGYSGQGYLSQGIETAAEALRKAGVDIMARYGSAAPGSSSPVQPSGFPSPQSLAGRLYGPGKDQRGTDRADTGEAEPAQISPEEGEALKEQFRAALDKLSLPKAERDELAARIERRLVLSGSQLSGVSVRYEKLEARGLDYVGKAMIAKQAIASRSLVEVNWSGGSASRIFGIPVALEKQKQESILVLDPSSQTEDPLSSGGRGEGAGGNTGDNLLRIPLGKISLLRRIKKSIFET